MTHRQHTVHDVGTSLKHRGNHDMKNVRKQTVIITRQWTEGLFSVPRRARHKNAGTIHTFSTCSTRVHRTSAQKSEGGQEPNVVCLQHQSIALPSAQAANSHLEKIEGRALPHAISRWKRKRKRSGQATVYVGTSELVVDEAKSRRRREREREREKIRTGPGRYRTERRGPRE